MYHRQSWCTASLFDLAPDHSAISTARRFNIRCNVDQVESQGEGTLCSDAEIVRKKIQSRIAMFILKSQASCSDRANEHTSVCGCG